MFKRPLKKSEMRKILTGAMPKITNPKDQFAGGEDWSGLIKLCERMLERDVNKRITLDHLLHKIRKYQGELTDFEQFAGRFGRYSK